MDKVNEEKERLEFELSNAVRYVFDIHGFIGGGGGGSGSCGSCGPMHTAWKVGGGGFYVQGPGEGKGGMTKPYMSVRTAWKVGGGARILHTCLI